MTFQKRKAFGVLQQRKWIIMSCLHFYFSGLFGAVSNFFAKIFGGVGGFCRENRRGKFENVVK